MGMQSFDRKTKKEKVICLYRFTPVNLPNILPIDGAGDCSVCKHDPALNPLCSRYCPIRIVVATVTS